MKRALVLIVLVAACGGSGDNGNPKDDYLSKAEAICAKANAQIADAKKKPPAGVTEVPPYVHKLVNLAKSSYDDLSALTPPSGDAAQIKSKLISPLATQVHDGELFAAKVDAAAAKNDSATLTQLVLNPPTKTRVDVAWMKSYGFNECVTAADTGAARK